MKHQDHLQRYDPGPVLVVFMIALTAGGIALSELGKFPKIGFGALKLPAAVIGVLLIVIGAALLISKIHRPTGRGKLLTTGICAPIQSGVMLACIGAILLYGSLALLVFPPIMYLAIIAAVKAPGKGGLKQIIWRNRQHDDR